MPVEDYEPVAVAARLSRPHPLVLTSRAAATSIKQDETGRLILGSNGTARLRVSRNALPRALRILDAI
jgi:hypothetical protein